MKVKALQSGFYVCIRNEGDVFDIPEDFGPIPAWMEKVEAAKPERVERPERAK